MKLAFFDHQSIKARVTLSTLAIFVFSLWLLSWYASRMLQNDLQSLLSAQQFSAASYVAAGIEDELNERMTALERIASEIDAPLMANPVALQKLLEQRPLLQLLFSGGAFGIGMDGTALASIPLSWGRVGVNFMERDYAIAALKGGKSSVGKPVVGKINHTPLFVMTVPIRDAQGQVIGALAGVTDLGKPNFLDKITRSGHGKTGTYLVVAPAHQLIVTSSDKRRIMEVLPASRLSPAVVRFMQGDEGNAIFTNTKGVEVLSSVKWIPAAGWYAAISLPTAEAFAPIREMQRRMWVSTILLTLLAGGLTWWMLRRQLAPLMSTVKVLANLSKSGQPMQALPNGQNNEIGELISGFNRLLEALSQRDAELRESEERWKLALDAAGEGVWDWSIQAGTAYYSPRYHEMLGFSGDEFSNSSDEWNKRIHPDDAAAVVAGLQPYMEGEADSASIEFRMLCKDGSWLWIQGRGMVIQRDADGKALRMIGTNTDISARKQAELLLQAAKAEAEVARAVADTANQAKSRFLAAASHDLRQPMTALALYTGMLGTAVKPGQEQLVSHLQNCVDSLSVLLNDLLDVSKLDAGVVVPKVAEFSFEALCKPLLPIYSAKAEHKGLQIRCRPAARLMLRTDQRLMHRLLGNLLDNAVQYTAKGGVLLATRRHAGKLWIEVWDTGLGIAQEQTPLIFEEFRQLGDAARNRGSGLGLAIVAKTAALLGLQIRVRSRPGRGSMFAIELPQGVGLETSALAPPTPQALASKYIIGVIDDNLHVLRAMVQVLQGLGHTVIGAACGSEFLDKLGPLMPDVVLSDYRLEGGETGFEVIESVRARFGADLPAIILTGDTDPQLMCSMAAKGIAVYYKPVPMAMLQGYIQQAVDGN